MPQPQTPPPPLKSLEAFGKAMFEAGRRSIVEGTIDVVFPLDEDPIALRFYDATRAAWSGMDITLPDEDVLYVSTSHAPVWESPSA